MLNSEFIGSVSKDLGTASWISGDMPVGNTTEISDLL